MVTDVLNEPEGYASGAWNMVWDNPLSNGVKWVIGGVWNSWVWFTSWFFNLDDVDTNSTGDMFKQEFLHKTKLEEQELKLKIYAGSFHNLCSRARRNRKPMLIIILKDNSQRSFDYARNAFSNEGVIQYINHNYYVYGIFNDAQNSIIKKANLKFPERITMGVWTFIVKPSSQIAIIARICGALDEFSSEKFQKYLTENSDLYKIICEEDPEY